MIAHYATIFFYFLFYCDVTYIYGWDARFKNAFLSKKDVLLCFVGPIRFFFAHFGGVAEERSLRKLVF